MLIKNQNWKLNMKCKNFQEQFQGIELNKLVTQMTRGGSSLSKCQQCSIFCIYVF